MFFFVFLVIEQLGFVEKSQMSQRLVLVLVLCVFVLVNVGGWLCWSESFDLCVHFRVELRIVVGKCGFKVVDCLYVLMFCLSLGK